MGELLQSLLLYTLLWLKWTEMKKKDEDGWWQEKWKQNWKFISIKCRDHTIMANKNINCSLFGLQGDLNSSLVGYEDATCLLNYSSLARLWVFYDNCTMS